VNIFELLQHHRIILNCLGMAPFLPKLKFPVDLMLLLAVLELAKDHAHVPGLEKVDNPSRRIRLEVPSSFPSRLQRQSCGDGFPRSHSRKAKTDLRLQKPQGLEDNLGCFGAREDGRPADDGARHKMRSLGFADSITCSSHWSRRRGASRKVRSHAERGNEVNLQSPPALSAPK